MLDDIAGGRNCGMKTCFFNKSRGEFPENCADIIETEPAKIPALISLI